MLTNFEMCHPHPVLINDLFSKCFFFLLTSRFCFTYFEMSTIWPFHRKISFFLFFFEMSKENRGSNPMYAKFLETILHNQKIHRKTIVEIRHVKMNGLAWPVCITKQSRLMERLKNVSFRFTENRPRLGKYYITDGYNDMVFICDASFGLCSNVPYSAYILYSPNEFYLNYHYFQICSVFNVNTAHCVRHKCCCKDTIHISCTRTI